ncbi:MAG: PAS domain S-box protein, partial [Deltaproteobacteria bacterium]
MTDPSRTNKEPIEENSILKQRIQELEQSELDRKRAEEALESSLSLLSASLESTADGILIVDTKGKIEQWNQKFTDMWKIPEEVISSRDAEKAINHILTQLADPEQFVAKVRKLYEQPEESSFDQIEFSDGRVFERYSQPQKIENNIVGRVWSFRDITQRRQAEQEMATMAKIGRLIGSTLEIDEVYERFAAETKMLIPFDRLAVNLHRLHEENVKVAYTSGEKVPGRCKGDLFPLKGSTCEVLTKTRAGLYDHPKNIGEMNHPLSNPYASVKAGMRSLLRVPLIYRDEVIGSLHFGLKTPDAYTDRELRLAERIAAQIAGAIGSAQMFSDLMNTENSLWESEGRFRTLVEQAAVGVAEIEISTGRFFTVNRRLCELVGRTEEEMLATTFQAITHPEDLHLHEEKTALMLAGKIGYYSLEKRYLRKDGEIIWVNITVSPLWKPGENPERNIAVVEDITDRKRMKEESDRYSRQLAMLHETSVKLMAELNLEALLQSIAQHALNLIGGKSCNCFIYRPELDLIELVATAGEDLAHSGKMRRRGEGAVGQVWATGAPLLINDYHTWPGRKREYDHLPSRTLALMPVRWGEEFLGVLNMLAYTPHRYTEADMDMLNMFAAQAAIAIHNAQLYDRIKLELAERKRTEEEKRNLQERLHRAEKMEALGQMAGGVAHDLNNILGILSGYSELLLLEIPEGSRHRGHV